MFPMNGHWKCRSSNFWLSIGCLATSAMMSTTHIISGWAVLRALLQMIDLEASSHSPPMIITTLALKLPSCSKKLKIFKNYKEMQELITIICFANGPRRLRNISGASRAPAKYIRRPSRACKKYQARCGWFEHVKQQKNNMCNICQLRISNSVKLFLMVRCY